MKGRTNSMTNTLTATVLTPAELEQGHLYLRQTRDLVLGATSGLSKAQWNFKPAPERWSIAENVEHMVIIQDLVLGPMRDQLAAAPADAGDRDYKQVDGMVMSQFAVRLEKYPNPEITNPTGRWATEALMARLLENYERLAAYIDNTPDIRQHVIEAAPLKALTKGKFTVMDGYQWALAAGAHNERHVKQMLEVKADPAFPSN